jgi:integrase
MTEAHGGYNPARFHDLRHTAAATMAKACVPLSTIQKIGGWKTPAMVARYTRFVPEGTPTTALDSLVKAAAN